MIWLSLRIFAGLFMVLLMSLNLVIWLAPQLPSQGRVFFSLGYDNSRVDTRDIYVLDIQRTILQRLTYAENGDFQPHISPDGQAVVFVSRRNGRPELFIMTSSGRDAERLFPGRDDIAHPRWSPDGTQILFQQTRDMSTEIMLFDLPDRLIRPLTNTEYFNSDAVWSPDGTQIAFHSNRTGRGEIFLMDANGENLRQLTYASSHWSRNPEWSPDGTRIAFASYAAAPGSATGNWDIFVINQDGSSIQRISIHDKDDENPTWSPDGQSLLFESPRGMRWLFRLNVEQSAAVPGPGEPLLASDRHLERLFAPLLGESSDAMLLRGAVDHLFPIWVE